MSWLAEVSQSLRRFCRIDQSLGKRLAGLSLALVFTAIMWSIAPLPSQALSFGNSPRAVRVLLGNRAGESKFIPSHVDLKANKTYKLILQNPSAQKRCFTAVDFATAIQTQSVKIDKAEVIGTIEEIALAPGGAAEWIFVAETPGTYNLSCSMAGHPESGDITIAAS